MRLLERGVNPTWSQDTASNEWMLADGSRLRAEIRVWPIDEYTWDLGLFPQHYFRPPGQAAIEKLEWNTAGSEVAWRELRLDETRQDTNETIQVYRSPQFSAPSPTTFLFRVTKGGKSEQLAGWKAYFDPGNDPPISEREP